MFLTTGQGVILVDAPPTIGDKLLAAIREVTSEPIAYLIYSHSHVDHIGAASMIPSGATIVAHEATAEQLRRANDPRRPVPTVTFADNYLLQVGRQRLELSYLGPAHEPGNIYIYAPSQRVLMVVDIVFPGWVPFKELALAEDVPAFVQAHDDILGFEFDTFVGGHLTRLGTRQDVEIQKQYIMDVRDNAMYGLQTVDFMATGQRVGFENPWLLFDTYLSEVTRVCAERTIPNWIDRLGGADVYTRSHCAVFADSLRLD
jgi:glyoxylase-like metal-dependent hydrolase (beta-lactamase superfamily II)